MSFTMDKEKAKKITEAIIAISKTPLFIDSVGKFDSYGQEIMDIRNMSQQIMNQYNLLMKACRDTHFCKETTCIPDKHKIAAAVTLSVLAVKPFKTVDVIAPSEPSRNILYFLVNEFTSIISGLVIIAGYTKNIFDVLDKDNFSEWLCRSLNDVYNYTDRHGSGCLLLLSSLYYRMESDLNETI